MEVLAVTHIPSYRDLLLAHLQAGGPMEHHASNQIGRSGRLYTAYVKAHSGSVPMGRDDIFVLWVEENRHRFYEAVLHRPAPELPELGRNQLRGFRSITEMLMFASWLNSYSDPVA